MTDTGVASVAARVSQAVALRTSGDLETSARLLDEVVADAPDQHPAYYELAALRLETGYLAAAAACLDDALRRAGADQRASLLLARSRYGLGDFGGGDAALQPLPESPARKHMEAFGAYLQVFPLSRALSLLLELKRRHRYLATPEVAKTISAAMQDGVPFAMARIGDGEGAWASLGEVDEKRYAPLYAANRVEVTATWFGTSFLFETNGFADLATSLPQEIASWDLTGIPYSSWLRHEYGIASPRGVPCLVNPIRRLLAADIPPDAMFCRQEANVDLYAEGYLPNLLRQAGTLSIITCQTELPLWLEKQYDLADVELLRVPGEHGAARILGEAALCGSHFPDRFLQLQGELARPWSGRLVLIAAGILGKFYAATIRRHGGIALDIGSLADAWMGQQTRPGHAALAALISG